MSYDEEQQKRSRVVVETPNSRREVVHQQTVRYPEERRGHSTGLVVAVALVAIAATAILFLFLTNSRDDSSQTNVNVRSAAATQPTPFTQTPVIVQTPMTMPTPQTVIIQQPPPTTTAPAPVIITPPPPAGTTTAPPAAGTAPPANARAAAGHDDASLQEKIDKAFAADPDISAAVIDATVVNGRVKLNGTVSSDAIKQRAERLAYQVKGVLGVDNKIVVSP
ncbi:MAG: BON domain-containing protein [Acidobacteriota bacterium]|nr:BON domain-containing protein [Acidobacteriota bacterium]